MRIHELFCVLLPMIPGFAFGQSSLAAEYPGDKGMVGNPDVLFVEDFEGGDMSQIGARYTERMNPAGMSLNADVPANSPGKRSLEMVSVIGQDEGARLFRRISPGLVGQVHVRYYIKYFSGVTYHHSNIGVGGFNPPSNYFRGMAGLKPTGSSNFSISPEYSARFDIYTYWMNMRAWADPPTTYYGNTFIQNPNLKPTLDAWLCVEMMVKLNDPLNASNGELALWLDGKPIIHLGQGFPKGRWLKDTWRPDSAGTPFEGFQWRSSDSLNLNWMGISHYVTQGAAGSASRVRFDHVVMARRYIGPLVPATTKIGPGKSTGKVEKGGRRFFSNGRLSAPTRSREPSPAGSAKIRTPAFADPAP